MKNLLTLGIITAFILNVTNGAIIKKNTTNHIAIQQQDTIKYLHENFIARKGNYQHKQLSVILNELHLTVKSYMSARGITPGGPVGNIMLFFEESKTRSRKISNGERVPRLQIFFETPIPSTDMWKLYLQSHGAWLHEEKEFFGKQIVKDMDGIKP